MPDLAKLRKLVSYLEENLRASSKAGLQFIDPRGHMERLDSKQNHVVFGRRGAGKSSLVKALDGKSTALTIFVNVEDFKDISFPNVVLHVLKASFVKVEAYLKSLGWFDVGIFARSKLRKQLRNEIGRLSIAIASPDSSSQDITTNLESSAEAQGNAVLGSFKSAGKVVTKKGKQVVETVPIDKLRALKLALSEYKALMSRLSSALGEKPIYLVLDDLYFVPKASQPFLVDYFHRMTKDTPLFLKIATIKHRTKLYTKVNGSPTGAELGHDAFQIDMDYTLDKFEDLQTFMRQLLDSANQHSSVAQ